MQRHLLADHDRPSGASEGVAPPTTEAGVVLQGLTPPQLAAVKSESSPLLVLASAGAGKTRVLTRRIAYRIATGQAAADHTLAITFTRKAAGELLARLDQLGLHDRVTAGTFHAIASAQLRRWWADRRRTPPTLLDRKSRLLGPLAGARPGLAGVSVGDLAGQIEWAKARMVAPEEFVDAVRTHGRKLPAAVSAKDLASLYARYEHEKTRRGLVDFDDLLVACADAIERDPAFAAAQRWKWRHLFVDEFQDLNPLQHRLLLAWLGSSTDLCVVGDPNQAIYGWNGADCRLLLEVPRRWPSTETIHLDHNHRCSPEIVRAAASILGEAGTRLGSFAASGPAPTISGYGSERAEARAIASHVIRSNAAGRPWHSMAVLARTNAQLIPLQDAFRTIGVPFWAPEPTADSGLEERSDRAGSPAADQGAAGTATPSTEAVTLCTFHRAKGLEWDEVWVVGMESGLVPISYAESREAEAEERRLLYVALTRASQSLHCSWARERTFGGRPVPREPSPWLSTIAQSFGRDLEGGTREREDDQVSFWRQRLRSQRNALAGRLADPDPGIVSALKAWRAETARASGVPAYVVLHDATISALASSRPSTADELLAVPGLGPVKTGRYGPVLLSIVTERAASA